MQCEFVKMCQNMLKKCLKRCECVYVWVCVRVWESECANVWMYGVNMWICEYLCVRVRVRVCERARVRVRVRVRAHPVCTKGIF